MSVSRKLDILERLGKTKEARELLKTSKWYRCGNMYYKPSAKIILDGNKILGGDLDLKNCIQVPFGQVDALEAKLGITSMPSVSTKLPTKGNCCK